MRVFFVAQIGSGARAVVCSIDCVQEINSRLRDDELVPPTWTSGVQGAPSLLRTLLQLRFHSLRASTFRTFAHSTTIHVHRLIDTGLLCSRVRDGRSCALTTASKSRIVWLRCGNSVVGRALNASSSPRCQSI